MNTSTITFKSIFDQTPDNSGINSIEIPIIQRDYAQGRTNKDVERIRKQFLTVLYDALTGSSEPVKLDFVYGNITDKKLIPLDGQQRLTTLFLLHWYIAKHEMIGEDEIRFLSQFTYKTRFSSSHFCENLMKCTPDLTQKKLSDWVKDQPWFMFSWEKDPTIHSMLVMLDEIHNIFRSETNLWHKLINTENPPISFYFLALEDMGLTDSLYIKMNSRGKPLTPFEHFKAEFEKTIKTVSIDFYNEFVHKVDNDWVDMLWDYRGDDDIIDDEFMRYYRYITEMICFEQSIDIVENDFDLKELVYSNQNPNALQNLRYLFNAFDCWKQINQSNDIQSINDFFLSIFSKNQYESQKVKLFSEEVNLFKLCCNDFESINIGGRRNFSLNNTLLLYAVVTYLTNKDNIQETHFRERIRIIRNLINNSSDEIREKRLPALLSDTNKIIKEGFIETKTTGYNDNQKNEEITKQLWREKNAQLIDDLNHLEDHFLLQGAVSIVGIEEPDMFANRAFRFRELFSHKIHFLEISKALLTIGDYSQLANWRFLLGNGYDSTWRELFTPSNQRGHFEKTHNILIKLLDSLTDNYQEEIFSIRETYLSAADTVKDWKYYFIKYSLMRSGNSGVYYWRNDNRRIKENPYEVLMMNTALSLNGKHWDPFLYVLFCDPELRPYTTLEEYGAPLIINSRNEKIRCNNSNWDILDFDNNLIKSIEIPQKDGFDIEDRIELMKVYLKGLLFE